MFVPLYVRSPLLLALLAVAAPLAAQNSPSASGSPPPTIRTTARTVLLDIVVTDHNGKPVQGLPRQDFLVSEDRHPQQVTNFEEHTVSSDPPAKLPGLPPNVFLNTPRAPLTDSVTLLLLDSLNTPLSSQLFVHQQMLKYLSALEPGRRIAIVTLGSQLRMIQGFTADSALLQAALLDVKRGAGAQASPLMRSSTEDAAERSAVTTITSLGPGTVQPLQQSSASTVTAAASLQQFLTEQTRAQQDQRVRMTIDAFGQLVRYLAGIPGRKNLVWFSSAFPLVLFPDADQGPGEDRGYAEGIAQTDALLSSAQVAVYPVAAEGLETDALYDVEHRPIAVSSARSASQEEVRSLNVDSTRRIGTQSAMEQIARDTGGKAFYNTNGLAEALAHVVDDGSHFYSLAYTPTNSSEDGKFRKIEVKLSRSGDTKGYKLSYRRGYYASSKPPPAAGPGGATATASVLASPSATPDPLHRFMAFGAPDSTQLRLGLRIRRQPHEASAADPSSVAGTQKDMKGPLTRYSVEFVVAAAGLALDETPDGTHTGQLEATVLVYDREGKALNWLSRVFNLKMNPSDYAKLQANGFNFRVEIDAPATIAALRSGVFDFGSQKAGTLQIDTSSLVDAKPAPAPSPN